MGVWCLLPLPSAIDAMGPAVYTVLQHGLYSIQKDPSRPESKRGKLTGTHMRQDDDAVPRQMKVRLDGVRADVDGAAKGRHRVLGKRGLVPAVRYSLREPDLRICCHALIGPAGDRQGRERRGCCQVFKPVVNPVSRHWQSHDRLPGDFRDTPGATSSFESSRRVDSSGFLIVVLDLLCSALLCSTILLLFAGRGSAPRAVRKSSEFSKGKEKGPAFHLLYVISKVYKEYRQERKKSETPKISRTIAEKKQARKCYYP